MKSEKRIPNRPLGSPPFAVQPGIQPRDGNIFFSHAQDFFPPTRNHKPLPNSKRLSLVWEGEAAPSRQTGPFGTPALRRETPTRFSFNSRGSRGRDGEDSVRTKPGAPRVGKGDRGQRGSAGLPLAGKPRGVPPPTRGPPYPPSRTFPAALPACLLQICSRKAACSPGQVRSRRCRCCSRCSCCCHSRPGLPRARWPLSEEPGMWGVAGDLPHLHATCGRPPPPTAPAV